MREVLGGQMINAAVFNEVVAEARLLGLRVVESEFIDQPYLVNQTGLGRVDSTLFVPKQWKAKASTGETGGATRGILLRD